MMSSAIIVLPSAPSVHTHDSGEYILTGTLRTVSWPNISVLLGIKITMRLGYELGWPGCVGSTWAGRDVARRRSRQDGAEY